MRVAVVKSGAYLDNVILRILNNNAIKGDFVTKINSHIISAYNAVILTYQNNIPNLPKLLEMLVLEKKVQVIYISNTMSTGHLYNLMNDIYFSFIEERVLEMVLPNTIITTSKFHKEMNVIRAEYIKVTDELETLKLTNKAKLILMNKGLSEADSHKFIINKAMEKRISKKNLVNLIIENKIDI